MVVDTQSKDPADTSRRIKAILIGSSGNLVEWYDFYVYSAFSLYFAKSFFPAGDQTAQLLATAGIFAVGFLMRPIGSWFFGRYADRHGRKKSMVFAVLLMCAGSAMIAVLPTYAQAGVLAPVLLLVARMIQGFSVGGEYGTTATYMSEVAAESNRGFLSSFQYVTLVGGQLMASLVLVIHLQFLSKDQMQAWGWRIPFALGAVLAIVALYLRSSLHETADLSSHRKEAGTFAELLRYKKALLIVLGYTAGGSLAFYTFTTYMQKYLVNTAKFDKETATYVMTVVLFVYMIVQPLFGALSDRIGRRNNMFLFCLAGIAGTVPIMTAIGATKDPYVAFALATTALMGVSLGSIGPTRQRALSRLRVALEAA